MLPVQVTVWGSGFTLKDVYFPFILNMVFRGSGEWESWVRLSVSRTRLLLSFHLSSGLAWCPSSLVPATLGHSTGLGITCLLRKKGEWWPSRWPLLYSPPLYQRHMASPEPPRHVSLHTSLARVSHGPHLGHMKDWEVGIWVLSTLVGDERVDNGFWLAKPTVSVRVLY